MPSRDASWTTRRLLQWTTDYFTKKNLDSPRLCAEMLLAHVLGVPRLRLYMDADRPAYAEELADYRGLVERAAGHEPVDYLVGSSPFFSLTFEVSPAVLVPRPSTETLVEHILQHARRTPGFRSPVIADVGTGSGAIAVTLAKHLTEGHVIATDIDDDTLATARRNAEKHGVSDRIDFRHGPGLEPLRGTKIQILASNPPYIPDHEWDAVPPNVKNHEPARALRAGPDGFDVLRPLVEGGGELLTSGGQLVLEHAVSHAQALLKIAIAQTHLENIYDLPDHEKLPRVLVAERV